MRGRIAPIWLYQAIRLSSSFAFSLIFSWVLAVTVTPLLPWPC